MDLDIFLRGSSGEVTARELSPLALAYIGDCVFELFVRTKVITKSRASVNVLHKKAKALVNAKAQSDFYYRIENVLTEEEIAVYKRGRNAKSFTSPKNADILDYRRATGLEAVFGYLYLQGNMERVLELFMVGTEKNSDIDVKKEL